MRKTSLLFLLASFLIVACTSNDPIVDYQILPQPNVITYGNGSLSFANDIKVSYNNETENEFELLARYLHEDFSLRTEGSDSRKGAKIILTIDENYHPDKEDGYLLEVNKKNIEIKSNSQAGVLNGIQSLRQIIREEDGKFIVQRGSIEDSPAFTWRAFMLDEARYFKGKEVVKDLLEEMSMLKMNVFHWHLTDDQGWRIEIKKYPKLVDVGAFRDSTEINHFSSNVFDGKPHGGFYTQEEIKDIVDYAAKLHIMVVPEIEMPGHASAPIAAYPWLGVTGKQIKVPAKFGVQYDVYDVTNERVIEFFSDVFDEVIELFPSPVIHIGGDEIRYNQWNASPKVQAYMRQHDLNTPAELQVFFTNNISNMLKEKGRQMMGWNEITGAKLHEYQSDEDTKDVSQKLADGTIVHFWKGDTALIGQTVEKGYDIVNSFHQFTYLDYNYKRLPLSKAYSFNPIPKGLSKDLEERVLGMGCQMWGEFIPTIQSMEEKLFPRMVAYAECAWTKDSNKDFDRFKDHLSYYYDRWGRKGYYYTPLDKVEEE